MGCCKEGPGKKPQPPKGQLPDGAKTAKPLPLGKVQHFYPGGVPIAKK